MKTMNIDSDYELQKYLLEEEKKEKKYLKNKCIEKQEILNKIRETITLRNQEMTKLLYIELLEILEGSDNNE